MTHRSALSPLPRRTFLLGAAAAVAVTAACGSDDGDVDAGSPTSTPTSAPEAGLSVARFFGPYFLAGRVARVPFGLADSDGLLPVDLAPDTVTVSVLAPDGSTVAEGIEAPLYREGLPRPYYVVEVQVDEPGFFDLVLDVDGAEVRSQIQVAPADDPVISAMPGPGDRLPALVTPTTTDAGGVDPICTRAEPCSLHAHTPADHMAAGEPFALIVATPAFCQTVICGPVLDLLLEVLPDHPGLAAVHAEVFRKPEENHTPPVPEDFAPVVTELGLVFEPVLYTVGADGVIVDRLDYIFGTEEISAALTRLAG